MANIPLLPGSPQPMAGASSAPQAGPAAAASPAPATAAVLSAIPGGLTTSEGKIVAGFIGVVGLLVVIFDAVVGTGALAFLPSWTPAAVDGSYLAASTYLGANYTRSRTALKVAALTAAAPGAGGTTT